MEPRARIEIRPRPDAHAALARRGSWDGPRSWRIVAHTTQADAPRTLAELQAARPAALWEYRTTDTQKNPPAHLHIPAAVAQLGIVLDLTTQTDATRTTWDREVSGMLMCTDADAMSRRAGSAALYLLRPEKKRREAKPPRQSNPDEADAYLQGSRDAQAGRPARTPKDPALAAAYRQGYEDAADDKRDQKWEEFWTGPAPTREQNPHYPIHGKMSLGTAIDLAWRWMDGDQGRRLLEAIDQGNPYEVDRIKSAIGAKHPRTPEESEAWEVIRAEAKANDREPNARRANHHDGETAEAGATFEAWHKREPSHVDTLDNLPDVIGVYIGRATRIGYRSDKWGKKGHAQDYDHDYTEPGYTAPEVWADRADLEHAHAIVIVGGNQRITPEGID